MFQKLLETFGDMVWTVAVVTIGTSLKHWTRVPTPQAHAVLAVTRYRFLALTEALGTPGAGYGMAAAPSAGATFAPNA